MPLFGAHMSTAGGLDRAFDRLGEIGGAAMQIFTASQRQWRAREISGEEAAGFRERWRAAGDVAVASHDSYLINLASPKAEVVEKSVVALAAELERCRKLGIEYLVMHPGSHLGDGAEKGIVRVAAGLDRVFGEAGEGVMILLETTAGQGTSLGSSFREIAEIIGRSRFPERFGVCFDTCHVFAAGYDISTPEGYGRTMEEFEREIGLSRLKFIHLNDSKGGCGSRVDRHQHIGRGRIGLSGFGLLVNDPRLARLPMVLETPKGRDMAEDRENLAVLASLVR